MARLEVELAAVGFDKFGKQVDGATKGFTSLESSLKSASSALEKANANALGLEKELQDLNKQFASGSISSKQFAKDQSEITTALASSRQAAQGYQAQITSINATISKGVTQLDAYGSVTKKVSGYHSDFSKGIRQSNGVSIEFNRIIQDAPFGMIGIGNNLQQLAANYTQYAQTIRNAAAEQGKTVTSTQILKGALGGILSPINLLSLGISVATSAWTAYTMWAQKSAKATKETDGSAKTYVETLKGVARAQFEGTQNALKDLTTLKLLYNAYQNVNLPLQERKIAYQQIQEQYPEYFKNIAFEEKASKDTKDAYDKLTGSILATSRARAAANLITKNSERQLENENKIISIRIKQVKALAKEQKAAALANAIREAAEQSGTTSGSGNVFAERQLFNARKERENLDKQILDLSTDSILLSEQNLALEKKTNQEIAKGGKLLDLNNKKTGAKTRTPVDRSDALVAQSDRSADLSGLSGVDREVETVRQRYIKLYADLSANAKKSASGRATYEKDLLSIQANEADEISTIVIGERQRVANEILRIQNESGVTASENRKKELAQIQKWYDEEILKARDSAEIIASINEGRDARINAVDVKYDAKRLEEQKKLTDKISDISEKSFSLNENFSDRTTQRNREALRDRLKDVEDYFTQLKKLYANNPLALSALGIAQKGANAQVNQNFNSAEGAGTEKVLTDLVTGFGNKFYQTLTTINQQADRSFTSIAGSLGDSVTGMLQDTFQNQFGRILKKFTEEGELSFKDLSVGLAGIAGGLISGLTKKTDSAGQAAGGALTGAAAGFAVGGPIGAAIGGLAGAVGGLLGASKARKEERDLQIKQLEETKKQTEIMRQNAVAYTSSIIGRMTDQGILTNVDVGAFGQLTAKVSGKDLLFVVDRTTKSRG